MIDGSAVNCHLNLLTRETCDALGARREQDAFVPALMSRKCDFEAHKESGVGDLHSKMIDWSADKLIFIPIFWGAAAAGHWGLLVVDRWVHSGGVVTHFDSLPGFNSGACGTLKKLMAGSPLAMGAGADWQLGSAPRQSCGGNDCGAWMLMIAAAHSAAVWVRVFMTGTDNDDCEVAPVVSLVDTDEATFGQLGRAHVVESIRAGKVQDSRGARSISILFE